MQGGGRRPTPQSWKLVDFSSQVLELGINEAPELEVPQPLPTFTGNPLEKSIAEGGGLTTAKPQS